MEYMVFFLEENIIFVIICLVEVEFVLFSKLMLIVVMYVKGGLLINVDLLFSFL